MQQPNPPLIGHKEARKTLHKLYKSGTFPHAIILHGPQGIGKRLLAEKAALTLMCGTSQEDLEPNFLSPIYTQIQSGSNADFHILEPEKGKKSISIDQTRKLLTDITLSSDTARTIIIDGAELMTAEAANALLKTLEEPQPNIHFFLVCQQISRLLPTIISRCRPIQLAPLNSEDTQKILQQTLQEEANLKDLISLANGRPGYALSALENKLIELNASLEKFIQSPHKPISFVESIAKKKQIPEALELLQSLLSKSPEHTSTYTQLNEDISMMNTLNLTSAWVLEKNLRNLI